MSYTLRVSKAGWEIQNGSGIIVTVPKLSMVEEAVAMLTKQPAAKEAPATKKKPAVKKAAPSMILRKEEEEETPKDAVIAALSKSKKARTAREIIERINPEADEAEVKNFQQILSILGKSKVLKRKKNSDGIFEYSVKT